MTPTQVEYWKLQETKRANQASESLKGAQLAEDSRANRARESQNYLSYQETVRHNTAVEDIDISKLGETERHNTAVETEENRANIAKETENTRHNQAVEDETARYQKNKNAADYIKAASSASKAVLDVVGAFLTKGVSTAIPSGGTTSQGWDDMFMP